jgi:hypothetical protein
VTVSRANIPEAFLQRVWQSAADFLSADLRLADGSVLQVLDVGSANDHRGGPDFLNARIQIDEAVIHGDIELHATAKEWKSHGHDRDNRYGNVVLHVVLYGGELAAGPPLPTLVLEEHLTFSDRDLWHKLFEQLYSRPPELPCYPHNIAVPIALKKRVVEGFGNARFEELVDRVLLPGGIASEQAFRERVYQLTMDALGYSQNRLPFRELSSLLPLSRLEFVRKTSEGSVTVFEALFFGMAGLLPMPSADRDPETNEYLLELRAHWESLNILLDIRETLAESDWAFFRLRPMNSPYRRLALAARLTWKYFSKSEWDRNTDFLQSGPSIDDSDSYWCRHTAFSESLQSESQLLGEERRSAIALNVVLPAKVARLRNLPESRARTDEISSLMDTWGNARTRSSAKYLRVLEQELLEGENVNCVRSEQGGLLLLRNFCEKRRCYECPIGDRLRQKGWSLR